jgi:large subunit ribosomal protein L18
MKTKSNSETERKWRVRRERTRKSISGGNRVMLTVFRSSKHIYAQLVDPVSGNTLGTVSSRSKDVVAEGSTGNVEAAKKVGAAVARLAREKSIEKVVFNRNGFLYHGRIKALADAAREAGLQF